jgi:hypothetical protein
MIGLQQKKENAARFLLQPQPPLASERQEMLINSMTRSQESRYTHACFLSPAAATPPLHPKSRSTHPTRLPAAPQLCCRVRWTSTPLWYDTCCLSMIVNNVHTVYSKKINAFSRTPDTRDSRVSIAVQLW